MAEAPAVSTTDVRTLMADAQRVLSSPTAAACAALARRVEALPTEALPWPEVRVGVLASCTLAPLAPYLVALGAGSGIAVRVHVSGGDDWPQEVLDPTSRLRQFGPDVVIMALQVEDLAEPLVYDFLSLSEDEVEAQIDSAIARVADAVAAIRASSAARLLVHGFPRPVAPALGIMDDSHERGQTAAFRRLDERLRHRLAAVPDTYVLDLDRLVARVGYSQWHDARMWALARMPFAPPALQALADEHLRYLRAFAGRARKVLVVDLDGTLWGGVAGEDGPEGIQLGVGPQGRAHVQVQRALRDLSRRGVLLAVNSKNNPDDALEIIETHPAMILRRDDFAAVRINWQDKAQNLVELAAELGLGLDSFVFADDSAAECERVRQALPEVLTVHLTGDPSTYAHTIRGLGVFDALSFGDENRTRTAMYRSEARRRELQQSVGSLEEFYRSLDMQLDVACVDARTLARAAELTQRTNQFNLTTRRFTTEELRAYLSQPGHAGFVFRLRDRFGDHGTIGLALLEEDAGTLVIANLLLSCRVLKRTVEDSVLAFLCGHAASMGAQNIEGRFRPTRRNAPAAALYQSHGFLRTEDGPDGVQRFVRRAGEPVKPSPWIRMPRREPGDV